MDFFGIADGSVSFVCNLVRSRFGGAEWLLCCAAAQSFIAAFHSVRES
jgi:hypothetical protein